MGGAEGTKLDLDFMDMEKVCFIVVVFFFNIVNNNLWVCSA